MNLEIHEAPDGHYMKDGRHMVYFLCKKEDLRCNKLCNETSCAHTYYMEKSKHYQNICLIPEEEFLERFEKIYFSEGGWYDWWEKEKKPIWNCRTHEWEDEE